MPEKLARSVVVTPCCRHHSLTERPLLRHSWICAAHSCSSARCFNSALVILTPHNTTVAKPFATFRYYCLMCVYARLGLTVTKKAHNPRKKHEKVIDTSEKKGCISMANIRENTKNGKVISYRFIACMERDVRGKQIRKYTTWTPPEGMMRKGHTLLFFLWAGYCSFWGVHCSIISVRSRSLCPCSWGIACCWCRS